jgi:hypothetical protein
VSVVMIDARWADDWAPRRVDAPQDFPTASGVSKQD